MTSSLGLPSSSLSIPTPHPTLLPPLAHFLPFLLRPVPGSLLTCQRLGRKAGAKPPLSGLSASLIKLPLISVLDSPFLSPLSPLFSQSLSLVFFLQYLCLSFPLSLSLSLCPSLCLLLLFGFLGSLPCPFPLRVSGAVILPSSSPSPPGALFPAVWTLPSGPGA